LELPRKWRVLYVRPRYEKKVEQQLNDFGVEHYLPMREVVRQWSDRKKKVILPVFPGYLFVHVNERERSRTFDAFGVLKYIHFSGVLAEVKPEVIENLRIMVEGPGELEVTGTALPIGTEVRIKYGPLAGLKGHLIEYRGNRKIAVVIEAIQQTVMVEVGLSEVE
jgi:transcription antitermination factor NusG